MRMRSRLLVVASLLSGLAIAAPVGAQTAAPAPDAVAVAAAAGSLPELERLAARGDARAAEVAGRILYTGRTPRGDAVTRDLPRARAYLAQAAAGGSAEAALLVARIDGAVDADAADQSAYVPGPYGC